jgi:tripartite-type tricarboxylate transporter receptor subunit TctC
MHRRAFLKGALAAAAASAAPAFAQAWPSKPIKLIVPFPPAGGTDVLSRALAQAITVSTQWSFVVDNRPGAGGNIGLEAAARSPADGYTIAMGQTANLAVNPALYAKMPFDAVKDFTAVALVSSQPLILVVGTNSPYKALRDLVDAAKKAPGKLNMASPSNGTMGHVGGEMFQRRAGIQLTHVPYKGAGPAVADLMGGSVDCYFGNSQAVGGLVAGGRLRPIAVTSPRRLASLPDTPTVAESGYAGFEAATWSGVVAPTGTPKAIVERLNAEINKALGNAEMAKKLAEDGSTPLGGTPQQFADFIKAEIAKWGAVVREAGIKLD